MGCKKKLVRIFCEKEFELVASVTTHPNKISMYEATDTGSVDVPFEATNSFAQLRTKISLFNKEQQFSL